MICFLLHTETKAMRQMKFQYPFIVVASAPVTPVLTSRPWRLLRINMGISDEIEFATIAFNETTMLEIKA